MLEGSIPARGTPQFAHDGRLRSACGGLDVFNRYRRKIVAANIHVDYREALALMRGKQRLTQIGCGRRLEAGAAPVLRKFRIGPRWDFEQVAPVGRDRAKDAPAAVVDHYHDRIGAEARSLRNLRPG